MPEATDWRAQAAHALRDNAAFQLVRRRSAAQGTARLHALALERGQVCLRQGDAGLLFLSSAVVKATLDSAQGRSLTLGMFGPGDTLGAGSLMDDGGATESHVVVQSGTALRVDLDWLRAELREEPSVSLALSRELARQLRHAQDRALRLKVAIISALVADWMLDVGDPLPGLAPSWQQSEFVSQDDLAEQVGASREAVNRVLRSFVLRGWLRRRGGSWRVLDRRSLELHAGRGSVGRVAS
jgi:CRP/FNR family transcriptional regulator, cyclic AMP receptor protein